MNNHCVLDSLYLVDNRSKSKWRGQEQLQQSTGKDSNNSNNGRDDNDIYTQTSNNQWQKNDEDNKNVERQKATGC